MVGRDALLGAFLDAVEGAWAGGPRVILLSGEAGIGKSRLLAEAGRRLPGRMMVVRCYEGDALVAYAPLREWLRTLELPDALPPALVPLVDLAAADEASGPLLDPPTERRRRHHALATLLSDLAGPAPLLLVIEDLHWADESSLAALLYLARHLAGRPIAIAQSYRHGETGPALAAYLEGLSRERLAHRFRLEPLAPDGVAGMVRAMLGDRPLPNPSFAAALRERTEGNPFFIEEMIATLAGTGHAPETWDRATLLAAGVPDTIQYSVQRRLAALPDGAARLVRLAAVIGQHVPFALLQRVSGEGGESVLAMLATLIDSQLLVERSADHIAFRHALIREAVYSALLARERRNLHRRIVEQLSPLIAAGERRWAGELASHAYAAGLWEQVAGTAPAAGERALAFNAPRAAVEQYTRALEANRQLGRPLPPAWYRARGQAHERLGAFESAREDYQAALARAEAADDPAGACQALLDLGFLWTSRSYQRAGEYLREAVARARTLGEEHLLAESLNRTGNWYLMQEAPDEALRRHEEALAILERAHHEPGIAATHDLIGTVHFNVGDVARAVRSYQRAAAGFEALGDLPALASTRAMLATRALQYLGDTSPWGGGTVREATIETEQVLVLMQSLDWRSGEVLARGYLAMMAGMRGRYDAALADAARAGALASEIEHLQWQVLAGLVTGILYVDLLAPDAARPRLEETLGAARHAGSMIWVRCAGAFLARAYLLEGALEQAAAILDELVAPGTPMELFAQRQGWAARAELALAGGEFGLALEILNALVAAVPAGASRAPQSLPRLSLLRGRALSGLGQDEPARLALQAAAEGAERFGARPIEWRVRVALADHHAGAGRRAAARRERRRALQIVEAMAATLPDDGLRDRFVAVALRRPAGRGTAGPLTRRETEVAALVAAGQTNRAIAAHLVVGERTAEKHVANILSKLGFNSRAQIAAWAVREGVATPRRAARGKGPKSS